MKKKKTFPSCNRKYNWLGLKHQLLRGMDICCTLARHMHASRESPGLGWQYRGTWGWCSLWTFQSLSLEISRGPSMLPPKSALPWALSSLNTSPERRRSTGEVLLPLLSHCPKQHWKKEHCKIRVGTPCTLFVLGMRKRTSRVRIWVLQD